MGTNKVTNLMIYSHKTKKNTLITGVLSKIGGMKCLFINRFIVF